MEVESIFISDLHLGGGLTRLDELFCFLGEYRFNHLFLVGDIFDTLRDDESLFFLDYLYHLMKLGKQVVFIKGNHDDERLVLIPCILSPLDEYIYTTKSGSKMMIIHGDRFDRFITNQKWNWFGKICYSVVIGIYSVSFASVGHPARRACKLMINTANRRFNHINRIYDGVTRYASDNDCDVVITGHTHLQK